MISETDKKMMTAYSRLFKQIADSGKPKKISKENKKDFNPAKELESEEDYDNLDSVFPAGGNDFE